MLEWREKLATCPEPDSLMTIEDLWTRPHIARQMLAYQKLLITNGTWWELIRCLRQLTALRRPSGVQNGLRRVL